MRPPLFLLPLPMSLELHLLVLQTSVMLHLRTSVSGPSCLPAGSEVKASACSAGDLGLIPESGRSPGEGNGNPLQYSCLENPMEGGAWWATAHGVAKSRTRLSGFPSLHLNHYYPKYLKDVFPVITQLLPSQKPGVQHHLPFFPYLNSLHKTYLLK